MPVYDEEATVERAIERVLGAMGTDSAELVVVDDGSRDRTGASTAQWPDRSHPRSSEPRQGAGDQDRAGGGTRHLRGDPRRGPRVRPERPQGSARAGVNGIADAGLRHLASGRSAYSFWYVMGNRFLSMATNVIFNTGSPTSTRASADADRADAIARCARMASRSRPRSGPPASGRSSDLRGADHLRRAPPGGGEEDPAQRRRARLDDVVESPVRLRAASPRSA